MRAMQPQWFQTPNYNQADLTGGAFGMTDNTRSESGARFDYITMFDSMPVVLRARVAWAHDWSSNTALGAVFESLLGDAFTVNGAKPAQNFALTTVAGDVHLCRNWTLSGKFEGEFASSAQTYSGTGTLRYMWRVRFCH
jgi:uncharacterized protein with beta-barrel porin domain